MKVRLVSLIKWVFDIYKVFKVVIQKVLTYQFFIWKSYRFLYAVIATQCAVIPKFSINYLKIGNVAVVYKTAEGLEKNSILSNLIDKYDLSLGALYKVCISYNGESLNLLWNEFYKEHNLYRKIEFFFFFFSNIWILSQNWQNITF